MEDLVKSARSYVLYLLGRRDYSRAQLEKKLKPRGLDLAQITELLNGLEEAGLFLEENYKRARTRQLLRRGLGASLVKSKLRFEKAPVSSEDIAQAFEDIGSDPQAELRKLVQKKLRAAERKSASPAKALGNRDRDAKIVSSLVAKGHGYSEIKKILQEELNSLPAEA